MRGEYEKPWLAEKNPRKKWEKIIFWGCTFAGFAIGAFICYLSYSSVSNHEVSSASRGKKIRDRSILM